MVKHSRLFSAICAVILAACATPGAPPRLDLLGDPAPVSAASRTIVIAADTRWVNVTGGEVVKFVAGDKAFAWNFDGEEDTPPFDLNLTAPPGVLDHPVLAYVAPNPLYMGGGGRGGHGHGGSHK